MSRTTTFIIHISFHQSQHLMIEISTAVFSGNLYDQQLFEAGDCLDWLIFLFSNTARVDYCVGGIQIVSK